MFLHRNDLKYVFLTTQENVYKNFFFKNGLIVIVTLCPCHCRKEFLHLYNTRSSHFNLQETNILIVKDQPSQCPPQVMPMNLDSPFCASIIIY